GRARQPGSGRPAMRSVPDQPGSPVGGRDNGPHGLRSECTTIIGGRPGRGGNASRPGRGGRGSAAAIERVPPDLGHRRGSARGPAGVPVARRLGPDPRLVRARADRLREAGVPGQVPVVLAAAGSSDPRALADTRRQAAALAAHRRAPVVAAFAAAARPTVDEAVSFLADVTRQPVAVAAYRLAPGMFHDRLWLSTGTWVSGPIGDHPAVADLILDRFCGTAGTAGGVRSPCLAGNARWMADWTGGARGDRRK